jgi:oligopeptide/dipeptide ABC transporter ATP-binding protein
VTHPLLELRNLSVTYPLHGWTQRSLKAVDSASLSMQAGEAVGLVGESGCGKTSLARALVGLQSSSGEIVLDGKQLAMHRTREQARRIQIIFQDPYASLNPSMSVRQTLEEVLYVHRMRPRREVRARACELVDLVGLPAASLDRRPVSLSGGQRQRVAIARALAVEPHVLVADEPTTSLDVSVQAVILELFAALRSRLGLSLLLITHNLAVVSAVCDRIAVMYLGRIVEEAPTATLLADPRHPYTRRLLAAVPRLGAPARHTAALPGDPPDATRIPSGCAFHPRCTLATSHCSHVRPELAASNAPPNGVALHLAACHYAWDPPTHDQKMAETSGTARDGLI